MNKWEIYEELNHKAQETRKLIDQCLNTLALGEKEDTEQTKKLLKKYVDEYAKVSRQMYIAYLAYRVQFAGNSTGTRSNMVIPTVKGIEGVD